MTVINLLISIVTLIALIWQLAQTVAAKRAAHTAVQEVRVMADNVNKIEVATNNMKDALVAATAKASFFEGAQHEREKGKS